MKGGVLDGAVQEPAAATAGSCPPAGHTPLLHPPLPRRFCSPRWEAGGDGEREDRGGARVADADMRREGRGSPPGLGALGEEGAVTASCRGAVAAGRKGGGRARCRGLVGGWGEGGYNKK